MTIVEIGTRSDILLPEPLERIDEDSFWGYYTWQDDDKELAKGIVERFGETAKASSPYDKYNLVPGEPVETPFKCGSVEFRVVNSNTTKRPDYAVILNDFDRHMFGLEEAWRRGTLRKGYRTFEGQLYVLAEDLLSRLQGRVDEVKREKADVKKKVELVSPVELAKEIPSIISIIYGTDYSSPSEYNARMYQQARNFLAEGRARTVGYGRGPDRVHRFKELLLEDSFQRLGKKPDKRVRVIYPFEHIVFCHLIRPERTRGYSKIVNLLTKPFPEGVEEGTKTLRKGTKAGDLVVVRSLVREGFPDLLREKGFLTPEFQEIYDPRVEEGETYVRLSGVRDSLKAYIEDIKDITYNQQVLIDRPRRVA